MIKVLFLGTILTFSWIEGTSLSKTDERLIDFLAFSKVYHKNYGYAIRCGFYQKARKDVKKHDTKSLRKEIKNSSSLEAIILDIYRTYFLTNDALHILVLTRYLEENKPNIKGKIIPKILELYIGYVQRADMSSEMISHLAAWHIAILAEKEGTDSLIKYSNVDSISDFCISLLKAITKENFDSTIEWQSWRDNR